MAKTIFEEMGGTYEMQGDYLIPCIALPPEKETNPIGIWGQRHKRYLQQNHRVLYMNLLISRENVFSVGKADDNNSRSNRKPKGKRPTGVDRQNE